MLRRIEIIAECGVNWYNVREAKILINEAKANGADAVKFQAYSVESLFPNHKICDRKDWWENVKSIELTQETICELATYAHNVGIEWMCSAFDTERLSWVDKWVKRHKVGFRANKNRELIDAMIATNKRILLSVNCGTFEGIGAQEGKYFYSPAPYGWTHPQYDLLYCVPEYPTPLVRLRLPHSFYSSSSRIGYAGFSDHTEGIWASVVAMSRGTRIIEKHFTLDKNSKLGPDHICSIESPELKELVNWARKIEEML